MGGAGRGSSQHIVGTHRVNQQPVRLAVLMEPRGRAQARGPGAHDEDADLHGHGVDGCKRVRQLAKGAYMRAAPVSSPVAKAACRSHRAIPTFSILSRCSRGGPAGFCSGRVEVDDLAFGRGVLSLSRCK